MYRWSLYAAARKEEEKINGAMTGDFERIDVRRRISASRLIEGGLAMFLIEAINHHMEMFGKMVISPLVRNSLRVLVDS